MSLPTNPRPTWITLGVASQMMGVSESTIRRWADSGEVRSFRTAGGHRRVAEEDLQQIAAKAVATPSRDSDRISDIALARVKKRIAAPARDPHSVFLGIDPPLRDQLRRMGRQLVDLFARYIASGTKGERFDEDARTIGHEYGRTLVDAEVRLTTTISTFNLMRFTLEETAAQIAAEAGLSAEDVVQAVEDVLKLADIVLEGLAEVYEESMSSRARAD